MEQGTKADDGKLRYDLLPTYPLEEIANVFTQGAIKYDDRNWEKGLLWNRVYADIQRHLQTFWAGCDRDTESGLLHLAHAATGCMFLMEFTKTHRELDNRVKSVPILVYVAGPYHANTFDGIEQNIAAAERVSIDLIRNGFHVVTPHKNTAGYEKYEDADITNETWLKMDLNILSKCDVLYVLKTWRQSVGTKKEIAFAEVNGIAIVYEEEHPSTTWVWKEK